jgi:hypothetical protein
VIKHPVGRDEIPPEDGALLATTDGFSPTFFPRDQFLLPGLFGYSMPGRLPRGTASEPGDDVVPVVVERQGYGHDDGREENHLKIVASLRMGALSRQDPGAWHAAQRGDQCRPSVGPTGRWSAPDSPPPAATRCPCLSTSVVDLTPISGSPSTIVEPGPLAPRPRPGVDRPAATWGGRDESAERITSGMRGAENVLARRRRACVPREPLGGAGARRAIRSRFVALFRTRVP